ncbi:MAG: hypothetical protein J3K34DRAFT_445562, partial [Monoraphidium minutum]
MWRLWGPCPHRLSAWWCVVCGGQSDAAGHCPAIRYGIRPIAQNNQRQGVRVSASSPGTALASGASRQPPPAARAMGLRGRHNLALPRSPSVCCAYAGCRGMIPANCAWTWPHASGAGRRRVPERRGRRGISRIVAKEILVYGPCLGGANVSGLQEAAPLEDFASATPGGGG